MAQPRPPHSKLLPATTLTRARILRRNQTRAETVLWKLLHDRRLHAFKFRRQHPVGNYIADFCCVKARLIIELDGGQHAQSQEYDRRRTEYLGSRGFRVLRLWNGEVLCERESALMRIVKELGLGPRNAPQ
jgi:very-short-patch-repair endonuclease